MTLSIICVTKAEPNARPFLSDIANLGRILGAEVIFGVHGAAATMWATMNGHKYVEVDGNYVEEMLDPVIAACTGDYILRLDDDEKCSAGLILWLKRGEMIHRDSWFFSRCHLWPDAQHCLSRHPYFPDFQVRLSVKRQARRPVKLHAAHAYTAYRAPALCYIEHHVFITKTREERQVITAKYESMLRGKPFAPEDVTVVVPYDDPHPVTEAVGSSTLLTIAAESGWWREPGQRLPANLAQELKEFRESLSK